MYKIYMLINLKDPDKKYIGCTTHTYVQRFYSGYGGKMGRYINDNHLTIDDLTYITLAEIDSEIIARKLEKLFIDLLDTVEHGLNSYSNNSGVRSRIKCVETNDEFDSVYEAAEYFNYHDRGSSINKHLNGKTKKCKGLHFIRL